METKQEKNLENGSVVATFEVKGTFFKDNVLPSLNDLLQAATTNPMAYHKLKQTMEWAVTRAIRKDLKGLKLTERVRLDITWGEKAKGQKRDFDNIVSAGRKIINDSLTKNSVIVDDNPTRLGYGNNFFEYTNEPFIRVLIIKDEEMPTKHKTKGATADVGCHTGT